MQKLLTRNFTKIAAQKLIRGSEINQVAETAFASFPAYGNNSLLTLICLS